MPISTNIPAHLYVSVINGHNTWLATLLGVIFGAFIAGGLSLYKEHYRHVKQKLATAYAFKGEISALLDIIGKRKFIEALNNKIETQKLAVKKLKESVEGKYLGRPDEFEKMVKSLGTVPIHRFSIVVNEDIFYVKNSLKKDIGLLDDASVPVIRFYGMTNALLLDFIENNKNNDKIDSKFWEIPIENIEKNLLSFYEFFNIYPLAEFNLKLHESMLEMLETIIESGKQSIEELDKFIKKNDFWCKKTINFFKEIINHKTRRDTTMPDAHDDDKEKDPYDIFNFLEKKYQIITIMFSTFFVVLTSILYIIYLIQIDNHVIKKLRFGIVVPISQPQYYIAAIAAISITIIFLISIIFYQINEIIKWLYLKIISKGKKPSFKREYCNIIYELPIIFILFIVLVFLVLINGLYGAWASISTLSVAVIELVVLILTPSKYRDNYYHKFIFVILLLLLILIPSLLYKLHFV